MKISEKMDLLMKITHTSNTALGKYLNFDPSYISRIRSGKRNPPKNHPFLEPASRFFAEHLTGETQQKIAADFLCPGSEWPGNFQAAYRCILQWLTRQEPDPGPSGPGSCAPAPAEAPPSAARDSSVQAQFFFGNSGKREAVTRFLSRLTELPQPPRLLLYSNEEFDWMYEDPEFSKTWAALLFAYIRKGGRIRIAHTISRASGEMLVALQKWIPIYMTGAVEPYYYPKTLDRVFRKTLFIAEGHSAIVGGSVGERTENSISCLLREPQAVRAAEEEFRNFFSLCKPLMQIFNLSSRESFLEILQKFHAAPENLITVRSAPSFYTMPADTAKSMARRLESPWILKYRDDAAAAFQDMADRGAILTEVLNLPDIEKAAAGNTPFPVCSLLGRETLFYTAEEFAMHLDAVVQALKTRENYRVILSAAIPENELVYVKEDTGVILVRTGLPGIAFSIREPRMVAAFWEFLQALQGSSREQTLRQLEQYRDALLRL